VVGEGEGDGAAAEGGDSGDSEGE
jgi:peptidyl-tRNA hydrolase, PTH1 family